VSDDGSVVVGYSGWMPPRDAFIWLKGERMMMKLTTYLIERGVKGVEGWILDYAVSVSPNGKIICGTGLNPAGQVEGWIAKLD
jgi:hypothetical protein